MNVSVTVSTNASRRTSDGERLARPQARRLVEGMSWQHTILWLDPKLNRVKLSWEYSRNNYRYLVANGWTPLEDI